jgi:hypothetical protein
MYIETPDSTVFEHYGYTLHLPKYGYGINAATGQLERTDVIKISSDPQKQKWQRTDLPKDWAKKRKAELARQEEDEEYVDPDLEKFRQQEWRRRLCGVWVWINGVATYITGLHYFYLNWWQIDIGYPHYRDPDRKFFYVLQYCLEDPHCGGLLEATKRRQGKTYRGGCFLYEGISRMINSEGGIQSKTGPDARDVVFKKAIVSPFKKLPDFFIPVFDTSKGASPTSELKFAHTTKKGRRAMEDLDKPELNSLIDWASSDKFAYDGRKKQRLFEDEIGKTEEEDVYERHLVNKYCLETDGQWTGFKLGSTTVEDMTSGGAEFKLLWINSDRTKRDANGHTPTGMYRYMTPAYETMFFDDYGMPDVEKAKVYYLNRRAGLAHDPRALSSEIRKNPFNEHEMFRVDGDKCLFNSENLNIQLDWLSWHPDLIERGNFEWKDGVRFSEVIWVKNKNGRWKMPVAFQMTSANAIEKVGGKYIPRNNLHFRIGVDPFKYNKVKDNRRSDCAAFVGQMFNPAEPNDLFNDALICRYRYRAATTALSNEDILKMCWYFGCQALFERNVDHWKHYFLENNCEAFLMKLPGEDEYGVYSDGHGGMIQAICDLLEDMIENSPKKLFFLETVEELLEFDPGDTTRFDETIASGLTKIAMKKKQYRQPGMTGRDVNHFVKFRKVG